MNTFPPKTLLVPFDMTETSRAAARHARLLSERFGAEVDLVFVDEPEWTPELPAAPLSAAARAEILSRMTQSGGPRSRAEIVAGDAVSTILGLIEARSPDLVVMGTHGRVGLGRMLQGSVAEAVVRRSPRPVWTAHRDPAEIRAVLAPVNLTSYSELGLRFAARVAAAFDKPLRVALVSDQGSVAGLSRRLEDLIDGLPRGLVRSCHPSVEVCGGDPTARILELGEEAGLAVLTAHRKSLIKDALLGTTVERILREAPFPVVAVPSLAARATGRSA